MFNSKLVLIKTKLNFDRFSLKSVLSKTGFNLNQLTNEENQEVTTFLSCLLQPNLGRVTLKIKKEIRAKSEVGNLFAVYSTNACENKHL